MLILSSLCSSHFRNTVSYFVLLYDKQEIELYFCFPKFNPGVFNTLTVYLLMFWLWSGDSSHYDLLSPYIPVIYYTWSVMVLSLLTRLAGKAQNAGGTAKNQILRSYHSIPARHVIVMEIPLKFKHVFVRNQGRCAEVANLFVVVVGSAWLVS